LERRTSEADRRAAVIFQTARGRALLDDGLDIVDVLDTVYATQLGASRISRS
jgi:DNA-binding MarR family transcriptional regulator